MNSDFKDLLQLFNENAVEYLIIGGYAVIKYTEPRYTKDLDIWVNPTNENAKKVYAALTSFGSPLATVTEADFANESCVFMMGLPPNRIDILMGVTGVSFKEAWEKKTVPSVDNINLNFISQEDLIVVKKTAGRPQDLVDADNLSKPRRKLPEK